MRKPVTRLILTVCALLCPALSFGQGNQIPIPPIIGPSGQPKAGATITVCNNPATGGVPCTNYASIFSDVALTQPITQPGTTLKTDGLGNCCIIGTSPVTVYAAPGLYAYTVSGAGINVPQGPYSVTAPCIPGSTCVAAGSNNAFTGNNTMPNLNNILFVDGVKYTTVQAAINALPSGTPGGGTVVVPPGTYVGPTSIPQGVCIVNQVTTLADAPPQIWSKFNGGAFNSFVAGTGSQNMVKFTYTANLTIQDVSQICIMGIVLDFGGSFNLKLQGIAHSRFDMAVVNSGTSAPALQIDGDGVTGFTSANNHFYHLTLEGGNEGLKIGNNTVGARIPSGNVFDWTLILVDTQPTGTYTAVDFVGNCDTNNFGKIEVLGTSAISNYKGIVFNSASATVDTDADNEYIWEYDETIVGPPATSTSITVGPSFGNYFGTGVIGANTKISITSWANVSTFTWNRLGDQTGVSALQSITTPTMNLNANNASLFWQRAGVNKWDAFNGGTDTLCWNNATPVTELCLNQGGTLDVGPQIGGTGTGVVDAGVLNIDAKGNFTSTDIYTNTGPGGSAAKTSQWRAGAGQGSVALIQTANAAGSTVAVGLTANGIEADRAGFKHKRFGATTATTAVVGNIATTTFSWTTAFPDANYTVSCSPDGAVTNVPAWQGVVSKVAASVTVSVAAITAAAASFAGVDCIAAHDP